MARFRRIYGSSPLHLLVLVAMLAVAAAATVGWFARGMDVGAVLAWFAAAIVAHDLVVLPLYSVLDRIAFGRLRPGRVAVAATPYLRIPALLSGLLLLVFFPDIFDLGDVTFHTATGMHKHGYLYAWLITTGALFAISAVTYAIAHVRNRRRVARQAQERRGAR